MPWSGGVYDRLDGPTGWQDDAAASIPIAANLHDASDNDFRDGINNCLAKDGSNAPTANLGMGGYKHTNVAAATTATDYARYDQVTGVTPTGIIWAFSGSTPPTGWLVCDGSAVSRTSYVALKLLYEADGYPYGSGDGSTTFNLPDLRRRYIAGKGASDTLGFTEGGNNTGTAYASRSMSHSHAVPGHYHSTTGAGSTLATTTSGGHGHSTHTSASVDIGHTHAATSVTGTIGSASDGEHTHTGVEGRDSDSATAPIDNFRITGGSATLYTSSTFIKTTGSGHTHNVFSLTAGGQTLGATSKSLTGTVGGSDGTHSHALSGSLGKVTGGSDGNAGFNSDPTVTGSYLFLNYIVKT